MPRLHKLATTTKSAIVLGAMVAAVGAAATDGITKTTVTIGASNALTGPIAACAAVTDGARAYFKKVNDAGGVNGRKIDYQVLDDAYSAQRTIGNVRRLIDQEHIFALVSGCGTATSAAALGLIEHTDVPWVFPYAGIDELTQPPKKNVFSLLPLYGAQTAAMIDYVAKGKGYKTATVGVLNIAGHDGWLKIIRAKLAEQNITVLDEELIDVASPDKSAMVTTMKGKNPDLFVLLDSAAGAARVEIEMQRQSWKPKAITGFNTLADEVFLRSAGPMSEITYAPGVVLPSTDPRTRECTDALADLDKSLTPSSLSMFGCMSAKVFVEALRRAGQEPTRESLIDAIEKLKAYDTGVSGAVTFGPTIRQGLSQIYPLGMANGSFKVLGPAIPLQ